MPFHELARFLGRQQYIRRIGFPRSKQKHAPSPLGDAESARVDDPVGPRVAEPLQSLDDDANPLSAAELEDEGYVLDQYEGHGRSLQDPEEGGDNTRLPSSDPTSSSGLREVLARKPRGDQVGTATDPVERTSVVDQAHRWKPRPEHRLSGGFDLTHRRDLVACLLEPKLETADPGEKSCDAHLFDVSYCN
jgi:hypothetical protein